MVATDTSPFLRINRVVVTGELGCDIKLGPGLNIIRGEAYQGDASASNDCGKTVFTELIDYGLGSKQRFSAGDITKSIQMVFLEMELNGTTFTSVRNLATPWARISIYEGNYEPNSMHREPDTQVDPRTRYSDFLLEHLGIPRVCVPFSNRPGADIRPITFQDFMRLFYMDQKTSFQEIMFGVQPEWYKAKIVQILLGMSNEEVEQTALTIKQLTDEIGNLDREIQNITAFLTQSADASLSETRERREDLVKELGNLDGRITELKQRMRGQKGVTDELRECVTAASARLYEMEETRAKMQMKMKDLQSLVNSLTVDKQKVQKTQQAAFILSTIEFTRCPRCLQQVTSEMKERESDARCMLCGRPLLNESGKTRILDKDEIVDEEIKEARVLLEKYQHDLSELDSKIEPALRTKEELQNELDRQSRSYVSPFIDELERLLRERNRVTGDIELIEHRIGQWQQLRKREDRLAELKMERARLQARSAAIDTRDDKKIRAFSEYYESFLHSVGYSGLRTARVDPSHFMPLVNGHPYTEDTGIGFVSVKVIGYHYALLRFSLNHPCYYPRFLMMDSPRAFDINSDTYNRVLLQFPALLSAPGEQKFQVIITTRNLPEDMEQYVIERLNSRSRMLLRPQGQRDQS